MKHKITESIAEAILKNNAEEYITWLSGTPIDKHESMECFELELRGSLNFAPRYHLHHVSEDYSIFDICLVGKYDLIGLHFDDFNEPKRLQYSFLGLLLQESLATYGDVLMCMSITKREYCKEEGFYPHTFWIENNLFNINF